MLILFGIILLLLVVRLYIDQYLLKVTDYPIHSKKIPFSFEGYRILQLSDLHGRDFQKALLPLIQKQHPNVIVMTGDMVSANQKEFGAFYRLCEALVKEYPVYYIQGNHEGRMPKQYRKEIEKTIRGYGVKVLDNETVTLAQENENILLHGMWAKQELYKKQNGEANNPHLLKTMQSTLGTAKKEAYHLLLMHSPYFLDTYEAWGADLILCGHIHGGMIRLPIVGGVFSPYKELFPHFDYGKFQKNDATMIVSGGLSRGETGFRLFNRPEVVVITLHSDKKK